MVRFGAITLLILFRLGAWAKSFLETCHELSEAKLEYLLGQHSFGGALAVDELHARRGYVFTYNHDQLVPNWVAWHATKPYRDTPSRQSRWATFRRAPSLPTVKNDDYKGWFDSQENYARGHIAPFFIMGGDRDNDGIDAEIEETLAVEDMDDACTVFEANAMSNIAPQKHNKFNGQPGLWWKLESDVRNIVDSGINVWVFAGTVFRNGVAIKRIGNLNDVSDTHQIGVPHGFFKILIIPERAEMYSFLFDHDSDLEDGCQLSTSSWPSSCLVSIDKIESLTDMVFLSGYSDNEKALLDQRGSRRNWLFLLESLTEK